MSSRVFYWTRTKDRRSIPALSGFDNWQNLGDVTLGLMPLKTHGSMPRRVWLGATLSRPSRSSVFAKKDDGIDGEGALGRYPGGDEAEKGHGEDDAGEDERVPDRGLVDNVGKYFAG